MDHGGGAVKGEEDGVDGPIRQHDGDVLSGCGVMMVWLEGDKLGPAASSRVCWQRLGLLLLQQRSIKCALVFAKVATWVVEKVKEERKGL